MGVLATYKHIIASQQVSYSFPPDVLNTVYVWSTWIVLVKKIYENRTLNVFDKVLPMPNIFFGRSTHFEPKLSLRLLHSYLWWSVVDSEYIFVWKTIKITTISENDLEQILATQKHAFMIIFINKEVFFPPKVSSFAKTVVVLKSLISYLSWLLKH